MANNQPFSNPWFLWMENNSLCVWIFWHPRIGVVSYQRIWANPYLDTVCIRIRSGKHVTMHICYVSRSVCTTITLAPYGTNHTVHPTCNYFAWLDSCIHLFMSHVYDLKVTCQFKYWSRLSQSALWVTMGKLGLRNVLIEYYVLFYYLKIMKNRVYGWSSRTPNIELQYLETYLTSSWPFNCRHFGKLVVSYLLE